MAMCECANGLNAKLVDHNYRLTRNMLESNPPVLIEIHKIETRKRTPSMSCVASYCPFCGKKYPERKTRGVLK
jgi:hypothetical protein